MDDKDLERMAARAEAQASEMFVRRTRDVTDFRYDEIQEKYWDITTGTLLGGKSVNGAIPKKEWPTITNEKGKVKPVQPALAINDVTTGLTVEGSTWWPGEPVFLENTVVSSRGAMRKTGEITYNTYVPPDHSNLDEIAKKGDPTPWLDHLKKLFPDPIEHDHFLNFAAHMIQRPDEKINHGIVLGGRQGIGKDTLLHPLRQGVGIWNTAEIAPDAISSAWNPYVQSVLLIINEVRPHDEDHKASNFYNQIKELLAAPPDMLPMDVKYANTIYVRNLCHAILTTNEPLTMYIPAEDRRLFVMTSPLPDPKKSKVFSPKYFDKLWAYLLDGGTETVVKYLLERPLFEFNSNLPPAMTTGKQAIIDSAKQVRRTLIDDLFESFCETQFGGNEPEIIFGRDLYQFIHETNTFDDTGPCVKLLNAKNFHFKMDERGYNMVKNPTAAEWKNGNYRSRAAFVKKDVKPGKQLTLVQKALQGRPLVMKIEPIEPRG